MFRSEFVSTKIKWAFFRSNFWTSNHYKIKTGRPKWFKISDLLDNNPFYLDIKKKIQKSNFHFWGNVHPYSTVRFWLRTLICFRVALAPVLIEATPARNAFHHTQLFHLFLQWIAINLSLVVRLLIDWYKKHFLK